MFIPNFRNHYRIASLLVSPPKSFFHFPTSARTKLALGFQGKVYQASFIKTVGEIYTTPVCLYFTSCGGFRVSIRASSSRYGLIWERHDYSTRYRLALLVKVGSLSASIFPRFCLRKLAPRSLSCTSYNHAVDHVHTRNLQRSSRIMNHVIYDWCYSFIFTWILSRSQMSANAGIVTSHWGAWLQD